MAVLIYVGGQMLCSYKWQLLMKSLGSQRGLLSLVKLYFIGMFFNLFMPTIIGGDAIRIYLASDNLEKFPQSASSVFMERSTGLFALFSIAIVSSLIFPLNLGKYSNNFSFYGMLAYAKLKLKHYHEAISMYEEILHKAQEQNIYGKEGLDTTLYFYSESLRRAERYEDALQVLRQVIESNRGKNNWLLIYGHLDSGRCYDMLGQREKAIAGYGEVLRLKNYEKSHRKAREYLETPYVARN